MSNIAWLSATTHPLASDWAARVVVNGGAAPSNNTVNAISNFCGALDYATVTPLLIAANVFAPDDLIASITPLIVGIGLDPWTNNNFVSSDLSVNGLKGNGLNKYLATGVAPLSAYSSINDGGITLYNTFADDASPTDCFCGNGSTVFFGLTCDTLGNAQFYSHNAAGAVIVSTNLSYGLGFSSGNRTSATSSNIYTANSYTAFSSIGSIAASGGSLSNQNLVVFARNYGTIAGYSLKRFSFAAIHHGLTSSQCQALYNAIQTLRQNLGGGFV